jgi:hypothetical protein
MKQCIDWPTQAHSCVFLSLDTHLRLRFSHPRQLFTCVRMLLGRSKIQKYFTHITESYKKLLPMESCIFMKYVLCMTLFGSIDFFL